MSRPSLVARALAAPRAAARRARTDLSGGLLGLRPAPVPPPFFEADITPPGDAEAGRAMLEGRWLRFGQSFAPPPEAPFWTAPLPSERFALWLHGFSWLPDLLAASRSGDGDGGTARAAELVDGWIAEYGRYHAVAWHPDTAASRLFHWLAAWTPALAGSESCRRSAQRQAAFLKTNLRRTTPGLPRLRASAAVAMFGARLPADRGEAWTARGLDALGAEVGEQILPDGGHVSRSPEALLLALDVLRAVDALLEARGMATPTAVRRAIDRGTPALGVFRHADGALATFHGGGAVAVPAGPGRPFVFAPQSRFHRLQRGEEGAHTVVLVDVGGAPDFPFDGSAHLSPLAFEMSVPAGRIIVNCGWSAEQPLSWREVVRATAAHSTLTLRDRSAGELAGPDSPLCPLAGGAPVLRDASPVKAARRESELGVLVECEHAGYLGGTDLLHQRRLFLSDDGGDLRGEDALDLPLGRDAVIRDAVPFTVRFHLHPDVEAVPGRDGRHVRLVLGSGGGAAEWVFLVSRDDTLSVGLEPSAWLGGGAKPVPSRQIVIHGHAVPGTRRTVRWAIRSRAALEAGRTDGQGPAQ